MKRMNVVCALCMVVFLLPLCVMQAAEDVCPEIVQVVANQEKVKVNGVVLDMETQKPIARVELRVKGIEKTIQTNNEGKFSFEGHVGDTIKVFYPSFACPEVPVVSGEEPMIIQIGKSKMPSYPGGNRAYMDFLVKNIKYPTQAQAEGVQGNVVLQFVVDTDGTLCDVEVVKSIHPAIDEEAVRLVKIMPKWNPATIGGKPVRVRYRQPISFRL